MGYKPQRVIRDSSRPNFERLQQVVDADGGGIYIIISCISII